MFRQNLPFLAVHREYSALHSQPAGEKPRLAHVPISGASRPTLHEALLNPVTHPW